MWSEAPRIARTGGLLASRSRSEPSWAWLRRRFELDAAPERAPARLTADSRYVLYVNGRELARGPVRGNLRRLRVDVVDLAPALRPGANVVAVVARFFGRSNPWWAPVMPSVELGAGAFLFEARIAGLRETGREMDRDGWLVSDARWRAWRGDEAYRDLPSRGVSAMPSESCDARALPASFEAWLAPDYDDAEWPAAAELRGHHLGFGGRHEPPLHPYGPLPARPVPHLGALPRAGRALRLGLAPREPGDDDPAALPFGRAMADARRARSAPLREPRGFPVALPAAPDRARVAVVDFGEVVAGTVVLALDAPAGTRVDAAAVEFLDEAGWPAPDGEEAGFRYVTRGEGDRFETATPFGLRALVLSVRGPGDVALRDVSVVERLMPRDEGPFFACSDPLLERIHAVGRRTVDLCSQDAYLDCPTREQRGWTGDFVVHQMVDLATNADWRLARWNVEMAASPRPDGMLPMAAGGDIEYTDLSFIPDWSLHWIRALHNLHRYQGDRDFVAEMMPVAERVLRWFLWFQDRSDGLLTDVTGWVIIDWSSVHVDGKSSVLNALFARALRDFAEMAEWLGDAGRAAWARHLHEALARRFDAFWDEARGVYVDHVVEGTRAAAVSQHALAAPLAAGLVPAARVPRVVGAMLDEARLVHAAWSVPGGDARFPASEAERGVGGAYLFGGPPPPWWDLERQVVRAQPFFRYVVHDALAEVGEAERIAPLCRDWEALLARCETSWSETWYGGTVSHGWSATPTRDLPSRTLGVTPAEPGFARARVAPRLADLAFARGSVPTPHGPLSVDADRERVVVESPVPCSLELPGAPPRELYPGRHSVRVAR